MPKLLSVPQAAEALAVSEVTIYKLARAGQLPAIRIGLGRGRVCFAPADLERFIDEHRQVAGA